MSALTAVLNLRVSDRLRIQLEQAAEREQRRPSDLHRIILEEGLAARAKPKAARRGR